MANLKVDTISGIGTEGPVLNGGLHFRSKNYLTLPKGTTAERTATSSGISTVIGAIRYNTDSNKMECYVNNKWMIVSTSSPNLDGGARGLFATMSPNATTTTDAVDFITISTAGNATDFGNLSQARNGAAGLGSRTRALFAGGRNNPAETNIIDFHEFSSTGNFTDFGDLTDTSAYQKGLANQTRGVNAGGYAPSINDIIDFVTIASTGNALDFGNLDQNIGGGPGGGASSTRGVFSGGYNPSPALTSLNILQYITIASTGNAQDFGDMTVLRSHNAQATSSTRSVIANGYNKTPSTGNYNNQATSEVFTFATLGNAVSFGDMINTGISPGGTSDSVRGVWAGGSTTNTIQYVNISTQGDSLDFGDLVTAGGWMGGVSNGHGGL